MVKFHYFRAIKDSGRIFSGCLTARNMLEKIKYTVLLLIGMMLLGPPAYGQVEFVASNLPIVVIDTDSQEIADEDRIVAEMGIIYNGEGQVNQLTDPYNNYSGLISIELRGSTSQSFPKKSYSLETQYVDGSNRNVSLMDLPEENDWILYAPYSDKSLIRNILSYRLARELDRYAPRTKLCELVLNGEYMGVYVLIEKIKRDKNRVDIAKLRTEEISGDDVTGGYIIKIDKQTGNSGPVWFSALGGNYFQYEYPKHDEIVPEQKAYIKSYIDTFEYALASDQFMDAYQGYRNYADEASFVDYFILNEVTRNIDAYVLSTFFYKDKNSNGGVLTMGPIWDFNLAFGNANYRDAYKTEGFQIHMNAVTWWWERLLEDTLFIEDIKNRWYQIRENQFSNSSIFTLADSLALRLELPQIRNFERWDILGKAVWPNYFISESYEHELDYMSTWIRNRLLWLDEYMYDWTSARPRAMDYKSLVYPNPFTSSFYFEFSLAKPGKVSLILYDVNGSELSRITESEPYPAGTFTLEGHAPGIPASLYVLVLKVDGQVASIQKLLKQ